MVEQHEEEGPKLLPRASRPAQINVYRALLALERRGPLSTRDAGVLEGLRESLLGSGGLPAAEDEEE